MSAVSFSFGFCLCRLYLQFKRCYQHEDQRADYGRKQATLKLREDGKSIRAIAQTLIIARTTIWNVLKKTETSGVLNNRRRTGRLRKTAAVDDRNIVRAVEKNPKTVSDITNNLQRAGVSQPAVHRRLQEQKFRGYTRGCKPLISNKKTRWR